MDGQAHNGYTLLHLLVGAKHNNFGGCGRRDKDYGKQNTFAPFYENKYKNSKRSS
jgi:hypothetical protein